MKCPGEFKEARSFDKGPKRGKTAMRAVIQSYTNIWNIKQAIGKIWENMTIWRQHIREILYTRLIIPPELKYVPNWNK